MIILRCNTGLVKKKKKKKQLLHLCNPSWDHIIELTGVGKKPVLLSVSSNVLKKSLGLDKYLLNKISNYLVNIMDIIPILIFNKF